MIISNVGRIASARQPAHRRAYTFTVLTALAIVQDDKACRLSKQSLALAVFDMIKKSKYALTGEWPFISLSSPPGAALKLLLCVGQDRSGKHGTAAVRRSNDVLMQSACSVENYMRAMI
jgi:hypothetical protein